MNNQENYKKAIDQIHASDELKDKTIKKIKNNKHNKKIIYLKYLSACAVFLIAAILSTSYYNKISDQIEEGKEYTESEPKQIAILNKNLPRFKSLDELENTIKNTGYITADLYNVKTETAIAINAIAEGVEDLSRKEAQKNESDFSKTNVQVENVDEADIVKTDGKYIYYVTQGLVYIVKADKLEIVKTINLKGDTESFSARELYINKDKLIIIGNYNTYKNVETAQDRLYVNHIASNNMTEAIVYDIKDKTNPKAVRTVRLDGNYSNSRMIGDNIYLISSRYAFYYDGITENEILPKVYDSKVGEKLVQATDIVYFKDCDGTSFMTVAGFDINDENSVCTETFFGASNIVYASEKNLYITSCSYNWSNEDGENTIYKFKLDGSKIELLCKGTIKGNLNNQFSLDEYEGNLRVASTSGYGDKAKNQLYVLNEDLKEIGKIEDIAVGERIYAVRFMGNIGYVVTFEQVDPLFVIDLSNPRNPEIKGELKIPGYSSYLHPYDETHIIGIGYNTKPNGYGGVTNANMKMSMFDVSDLENPTELFSINIGNTYAYSNIMYNHKILFENKAKNLIGFPVTLRENNSRNDKDAFIIFKIDLDSCFEIYGEISHEIDYRTNIDRAIYIGNTLYTFADLEIRSYDLTTFEELDVLKIEQEEEDIIIDRGFMVKE